MTGLSLKKSEENALKWTFRLYHLIEGLIMMLRNAGFEPQRIQRIRLSAPLLAGAIVEWVWRESLPHEDSDESPGWDLLQQFSKGLQ
jgi:hypothetical protein